MPFVNWGTGSDATASAICAMTTCPFAGWTTAWPLYSLCGVNRFLLLLMSIPAVLSPAPVALFLFSAPPSHAPTPTLLVPHPLAPAPTPVVLASAPIALAPALLSGAPTPLLAATTLVFAFAATTLALALAIG